MALYGYARVSTAEQDCTLQEHALRAAGCEVIRAEKVSATRREGRTELALLLEFLRRGDTLVVTRVDRLARSIKDLQDIGWCPLIACIKEQRSDVDRSLVEQGVKGAWHAIVQQGLPWSTPRPSYRPA